MLLAVRWGNRISGKEVKYSSVSHIKSSKEYLTGLQRHRAGEIATLDDDCSFSAVIRLVTGE